MEKHRIPNSQELTGYKVTEWKREAFVVRGFTIIDDPASQKGAIPAFWDSVAVDGRLNQLKEASSIPTSVLGVGSWDEECPKNGSRYTIGIEKTEHTSFRRIGNNLDIYTFEIGASDWLRFEMTFQRFRERFWKAHPYKMLEALGYKFNMGSYDIGLYFEVYPPDFEPVDKALIEFWITVKKP